MRCNHERVPLREESFLLGLIPCANLTVSPFLTLECYEFHLVVTMFDHQHAFYQISSICRLSIILALKIHFTARAKVGLN